LTCDMQVMQDILGQLKAKEVETLQRVLAGS